MTSALPARPAARGGPRRLVRVTAWTLLLAGGLLWGRAAWLRGKAALAEVLIRRAWAGALRDGVPRRPWPWADTVPVARLTIPEIGYDEIVLEGASGGVLAFGPARLAGSAEPGQPGNVVLAGHRTSWFRPLERVRPGHTLELEWRGSAGPRRRRYRVAFTRVVGPDEVGHLLPTEPDALTLVTCYPFGPSPGSPRRFVVRGVAEVTRDELS